MKKIKLLVVANNCPWQSWDKKLAELAMWFSNKVELHISLAHTSFEGVPFVEYQESDPLKTQPGLLGVSPDWYNRNVSSQAIGYDIVLFVLPVRQWPVQNRARGWRTDKDQGPVELHIAADENEGIYRPNPGGQNIYVGSSFFNYGRHEIMHALFMLTGQKDTTHFYWDRWELEKALDEIQFPEPNKSELSPSAVKDLMSWLGKVLQWIKEGMKGSVPPPPPDFMPPVPKNDKIKDFCLAIQEFEGWYPAGHKDYPTGSRSWRNKNPGNLRFVGQRLAIDKDKQNFCIFKIYEDGFATLREMIERAAKGFSKVYRADMTIVEFFKVYAPSSDGNYPEKYALFVAEKVGVRTDTKIKELL